MQSLGLYRRANKTLLEGLKLDEGELESSNKLAATLKKIQNQPDSLLKSTRLLAIGNALYLVGDLEISELFVQESLAVSKKLSLPQIIGEAQLNLGNINFAIAKRIENLADNSEVEEEADQKIQAAWEYYQQAATSYHLGNTRIQAQLNQLLLLVQTKKWSEAQTLWPQIQAEINQLSPNKTTITAQINLARNLIKLKDEASKNQALNFSISSAEIAKILAKAAQEAKTLGDRRSESFALGYLGELYEQTKQFSNAENLTKQALQEASAINAPDISYRWQWQLGRLLKAQGDTDNAIAAYTEAVNTLQSLRSDLATVNQDLQFSFRDSVEPVYRELVDLLLQPQSEARETITNSQLQNRLIQARKTIESLQLAEIDNFFREACLDAQPKQIDQIDQKAAVIYPVILPDRLEVIISFPNQPLHNYKTYLPQAEFEKTLNQLRQVLAIPHANQQERLRWGKQVYDWLIRPIETELKTSGVETLVFVLDGSLRNIPMATLYNGKEYLIEQYSIAIAPGLQLIKPQPLTRERLRALTGGLSESRQGFSALPSVKRELEQVNAEAPGTRLLNQEFTATILESEVKQIPFPIVHLATHGQFSSQLENTFILAWDREINVKELDGLLRSRNSRTSNPIELLVLSACETATGDKRAALGLAGVAVRAGARSTLGTLWKVSDDSTTALMAEFYRQLANKNITKAQALRLAQISLLRDRRYASPYFWAPYVLVGNWL